MKWPGETNPQGQNIDEQPPGVGEGDLESDCFTDMEFSYV